MTRPTLSALVLDGQKIKLRLMAERSQGQSVCHVDWLRFTTNLRDAPLDLDILFPHAADGNYWDIKRHQVAQHLQKLEAQQFQPAAQAYSLATRIAEQLGEGFDVDPEVKKGHDFYAKRWVITLNGKEVGWVGFGASSDSPKQKKQAGTIHANLYGTACTFARPGWRTSISHLIREVQATITRIDIALDFFDGRQGGIDAIKSDYMAGLCDVGGKRPKCSMNGDWCNGAERSFYIGSKEAGKQTNVYEKGHQLFGRDSGSNWLRFELRYGNKLREIPADALEDPDAYFAGASQWHASVLSEQKALQAVKPIPCETELALQNVEAEVRRKVNWFERVAGATFSVSALPGDVLALFLMAGGGVAINLWFAAISFRLAYWSLTRVTRIVGVQS